MKYAQMFLAIVLAILFGVTAQVAHAFSVPDITHETRGKVSVNTATKIVALVNHFSALYSVDPVDIFKIMKKESRFDPEAKSSHNAVGLMQVIPYWHRDKLMGRNPFDIYTNIEVGVRIWAQYLRMYKSKKEALTRYSGGSTSYAAAVMKIKPLGKIDIYPGTQYIAANEVRFEGVDKKVTPSAVHAEAVMRYNSPAAAGMFKSVVSQALEDTTLISSCMGDSECIVYSKNDYG